MNSEISPKEALTRAARVAGTQSELARRVAEIVGENVSQGHIAVWIQRGKCPPNRAVAVSQAVGQDVLPHQLCPDVFPIPEASESAA